LRRWRQTLFIWLLNACGSTPSANSNQRFMSLFSSDKEKKSAQASTVMVRELQHSAAKLKNKECAGEKKSRSEAADAGGIDDKAR